MTTASHAEIGARIKQARKKANLTGLQLGELVGAGKQAISNYELGKNKIPILILELIAKECDVDISWLVSGKYSTGHQGHGNNREETLHYATADDFEQRIIGMLRRLPGESRQHLTNMITTAYYDHMESMTDESEKKSEGNKD